MDRTYTIDGEHIATLEDFYEEVGRILIPGQYWGKNLDAFNDILCWPVEDGGQYILIWENSPLSKERLGPEFDTLVEIIHNQEFVDLRLE